MPFPLPHAGAGLMPVLVAGRGSSSVLSREIRVPRRVPRRGVDLRGVGPRPRHAPTLEIRRPFEDATDAASRPPASPSLLIAPRVPGADADVRRGTPSRLGDERLHAHLG